MDMRNALNMGGGVSKKAKLVTDLTEEYRKLNLVLERTEQLSKSIADNLSRAKGVGAIAGTGSSGDLLGFKQPPGAGGGGGGASADAEASGSGMRFGGILRRVGAFAAGTAVAGMQAMDVEQYVENELARRRFGFFSGAGGTQAGSQAFRGMMNQGTATDPMDAARAAMMGASYGMMPGLANYSSIQSSAAMFSNLVPGAGLQGGMQATAALNQAANVNKLRMLGIQVRGDDGLMRSFEDIANDLWTKLNREKTGAGNITAQDIALSLQPGNALDMLLNQYFGNDPVLRQGVVSALMQKAGGKGFSKEELVESGALPEIAKSYGERAAASYGAIDAYTSAGVSGVMEANTLLKEASQLFEKSVNIFDDAVKQMAKFEILMGGGNGALGAMIGNIMTTVLGPLLGFMAGKMGAKVSGSGGTAVVGGPDGKPKAKPKLGGGAKLGITALIASLGTMALDSMFGDDVDEDTRNFGLAAANTGTYAATGAALGSMLLPGVGTGIGAVLGTGYGLWKSRDLFGQGDGEDTTLPLAGSPRVSSQYGVVRHLTMNGKRSPTYGKPHGGVDYAVPTGSSVFAVKDGRVLETSFDPDGFGNWVKIRHDDGYDSIYGHLSQKLIPAGAQVSAGDLIGLSGNSGLSTGPHLHFQVQTHSGNKVNPVSYISGASAPSGENVGVYNAETAAAASEQLSGSLLFGTTAASPLLGNAATSRLFSTSAMAQGDGRDSSGGSYTTYGGVTVNINIPSGTKMNEKELAKEVKRILDNEKQIRLAVSR